MDRHSVLLKNFPSHSHISPLADVQEFCGQNVTYVTFRVVPHFDRYTGKFNGTATLTFSNALYARNAAEAFNNVTYRGQRVNAHWLGAAPTKKRKEREDDSDDSTDAAAERALRTKHRRLVKADTLVAVMTRIALLDDEALALCKTARQGYYLKFLRRIARKQEKND